jgi:hypothetical protein
MVMFNTRMRPEVIQPFWAALQAGEFITAAAEGVGTYRVKGRRWILAESGHPAASWSSSEGPVSDVLRARGDRAGSRSRGVGAVYRPAAGSRTVDGLA